jgi:hypothetical protein
MALARPALDGRALLRWISLELPEAPWGTAEPFVGFVYLDAQAGLSAKGWREAEALACKLTVRLPIGVPSRILDDAEATARGLPVAPDWLRAYGPQPARDAPWRHDPALIGRFHVRFPDDLQVVVHDGEPRRTERRAESCWVRIDASDDGAPRPVDGQPAQRRVYGATLLNQPHYLTSIKAGDRLRLLAAPGGAAPLMVTDDYLAERPAWRVTPCDGCGLHEGLDPPSVMAATRFPDLDPDARPIMFTARCTACSGMLGLERVDRPVGTA